MVVGGGGGGGRRVACVIEVQCEEGMRSGERGGGGRGGRVRWASRGRQRPAIGVPEGKEGNRALKGEGGSMVFLRSIYHKASTPRSGEGQP